jgi:hypothetical protein
MGQLMVLKRRQGMASPYTCFTCDCGLSFQWIDVSPIVSGLTPTQTGQHAATGTYINCNGTFFYHTVTGYASWWSANTPVATVNNTTYKGQVTGVAGGTGRLQSWQ